MAALSREHEVTIECCAPCNYLDIAGNAAKEILSCWGPIIKDLTLQPTA
jgi:predicted Rdx family selenoprotein